MSVTETARTSTNPPMPTNGSTSGRSDTLNGQSLVNDHEHHAAEGSVSPQANSPAAPILLPPAGTQTAQPDRHGPAPIDGTLAGHKNGRGHHTSDTQVPRAPAPYAPGAHVPLGSQGAPGTGDQAPPAARHVSVPMTRTLLADPLLALAADVLGDLEKVRIANENRLRQLTRSQEDSDGETRGFGLDESHPDVARLAALVEMLGDAEHKGTLNLGRLMRKHPLGPWLAAQKGIGEKQGARLLAAIGDPYVRPEISREDGTVEPSRPRLVSELWAFCGYHVIKAPVSGHGSSGPHRPPAVDGPNIPSGQKRTVTHIGRAGGEQNRHPGQDAGDDQEAFAGVAPKRARGAKANWSSAAKMRAFLVAESCIKQSGTPYREVYDATREKYADAIHQIECVRCGPSGKPAQAGSPLSAGHQHARALRAVAKEVLRDLWREAKRIHEEAPASQGHTDTQKECAGGDHEHGGQVA